MTTLMEEKATCTETMKSEVDVFKTQVSLDVNESNAIQYDDWVVSTRAEAEFRNALQEVADTSIWESDITTADMEVFAIKGCEEWQELIASKPEFLSTFAKAYEIPENIVHDTANHTGLMLKVNEEYIPVRTSAMKSMLETAKINGNALKKMSVSNLATVLNYCLEVAKGSTLLLKRAGKASAVLSADAKGYGILPMEELFDVTKEEIKRKFSGECRFSNGEVSHEYMRTLFEVPKCDEKAFKEYKDFTPSVYDLDNLRMGIVLKSSDVGIAAATLEPVFIMNNRHWRIGSSEKLHHKPGNSMEDFREIASMMFAKLDKTIETFKELAKISIQHPHNAFLLACKKAKIPKKLAAEALEEFSMMVAEDEVTTAHDVYLGISEVLFYAAREGMKGKDVSLIEDNVCKVLSFDWKNLDLPGNHTW